jgi:DNA primase
MAMRQSFPDVERPKILQASQASLWKPEGLKALTYLRQERFLSDEVIRQFQFGYCPAELDHELAGRIVMPLCDTNGNVVVFTTRNPWAPKQFQHWHESFDKTNYLYGLHLAKQTMRSADEAIVVEGQFDVTYAHTVGLTQTVGLCGSAFTIMHAAILRRYASDIYLILDPDASGEGGVKRAMEMYDQYFLRNYDLRFIPVTLPDNQDPDEFLRKNGVRALQRIKEESKAKVLENA